MWSPVLGVSVGYTNLVPWSPKLCPLRAHFLQGSLSEEELARLGGQDVATLSPTTRWEIHNISGVCGELWATEGTMWGMEENLSGCRLPRPGTPRDKIRAPSPCPGPGSEGVLRTLLLLGSDCHARGCLFLFVCMCTPVSHTWALLRVCVPI